LEKQRDPARPCLCGEGKLFQNRGGARKKSSIVPHPREPLRRKRKRPRGQAKEETVLSSKEKRRE